MATIFASNPIDSQTRRSNAARSTNFVDRLADPLPNKSSGPFSAFFQVMISLGLLPLLLWPVRWMEFLDEEREVLQDHIAWWRRRADEKEARRLDKISARFKRRPILMVIPWLAVAFNGLVMGMMITQGATLNRIWEMTFDHVHHIHHETLVNAWQPSSDGFVRLGHTDVYSEVEETHTPPEADLYKIWLVSLCVAYGIHWRAVRSHAVNVQALVDWTNKLGKENNFSRIKPNVTCIGLNVFWILLGIGLCSIHAWWVIPMIFAGAMQRQYVRRSSQAVRVALADQTREVFAFTRTGPDRMCRSVNCGCVLPAAANYCPRCGSHV